MDILSALNILRRATDEALKCHAAEAILTLKEVGERLQADFLPTTLRDSASEDSASSSFSNPIESTPSRQCELYADSSSSPGHLNACEPLSRGSCTGAPGSISVCDVSAPAPSDIVPPLEEAGQNHSRKTSNDVVSKLGDAIMRTIPWVWEASNKNLNLVDSCKRKQSEDRRLEDIRRIEGDSESNEHKVLRLLAIRSLASEFRVEQSRDKSRTRVDELVAYVHSVEACNNEGQNEDQPDPRPKGRRSDVSHFVERHSHISTAPQLANRAINNGVKHLVFEELLRHRLRNRRLPGMCDAVSAVLGLSINNFKSLPYKRMPDLLDVLLSDEMKISLQSDNEPEHKRPVMEIIWGMNSWFTRLQAEYDDITSRAFTPEPEPQCAKRSRHAHGTVDSRIPPTYQLGTDDAHLMTTELDITSTSDTERGAEPRSQGSNDIPVLDTRPSPNVECMPFENFNPFRDIDYLQDFNPFQDFDLFQDIELFQDFDPFQDLNPLPDFDFGFPHVPPDEIPETAENVPLDCIGATPVVPTTPGQDGQVNSQDKGGIAGYSSSSILIPQTVC